MTSYSVTTTTTTTVEEQYQRGCALADVNSQQSISIFENIIDNEYDDSNDLLIQERSIYALAEIYVKENNALALQQLLIKIRVYFNRISKAKTGKIMRSLIDNVSKMKDESSVEISIALCTECIEWCIAGKRLFLKQQIECRLCMFYLQAKQYQSALKLMSTLVRDVKKMDDKHMLVEVHLIESKIDHALQNIAKAKAALTSARAAANSIYIGPQMQAEIDLHAGRLATEERDYKTAFSYFYEAFEGLDGLQDSRAPQALKYMLLSKIMNDKPSDVQSVIQGKLALKYHSSELECMKAVAKAYSKRSLHAFESIIGEESEFYSVISTDLVVQSKLTELRDKLLEQNLLRLLEPFSRVEISHISKLINLPNSVVQSKLSAMILDQKFNGILDQGSGAIIVFEEVETNKCYSNAKETIEVLNMAVDALFTKSKLIDS